jgi:predicted DNA-binding transcriptional regulator AlpA
MDHPLVKQLKQAESQDESDEVLAAINRKLLDPDPWGAKEVGEYLGIHHQNIYRLLDEGRFPKPFKTKPRLYWDPDVIRAYAKEQRRKRVLDAARRKARSRSSNPAGRPPERRHAAEVWLQSRLASGKVAAHDVYEDAEMAGIAARTLRKAADALGVIRDPAGGGPNVTWELPGG